MVKKRIKVAKNNVSEISDKSIFDVSLNYNPDAWQASKDFKSQYEADLNNSSIPIEEFKEITEGLKPRSRHADLKLQNSQGDPRIDKYIDYYERSFKTAHKGKTHIDPSEIPAGYVAMCARESIRGRPDHANLRDLEFVHGWKFAKPEQMPSRAYYTDKGEIDDTSGRVRIGSGLVVMIREKEIHEAHLKYLQRQRNINNTMKNQMRSIDGELHPFASKRSEHNDTFFPSNEMARSFSTAF